jgi:hypothetical protein
MTKNVSSVADIVKVMSSVQDAVRAEIAKRMADGEEIAHAENGRLMISGELVEEIGRSDLQLNKSHRKAA